MTACCLVAGCPRPAAREPGVDVCPLHELEWHGAWYGMDWARVASPAREAAWAAFVAADPAWTALVAGVRMGVMP